MDVDSQIGRSSLTKKIDMQWHCLITSYNSWAMSDGVGRHDKRANSAFRNANKQAVDCVGKAMLALDNRAVQIGLRIG